MNVCAGRRVLDITITADQDIDDGAPLARFASDLRELIETATVLD